MGDLIDRDVAIAFVDCGHLRPPTELAWSDKDVVDMLKRMPSAQPEQRWIPVTERLPDEWKRVLIQNDEGLFLIGFTKDRGWGKEWFYQYEMYDYDAYVESEQGKIVAWCELPEPWKGE